MILFAQCSTMLFCEQKHKKALGIPCVPPLSFEILSASMISASTSSVQSLLTALIVKDGFRLTITVALQLHKLGLCMPREVCVSLCQTYLLESSKKPAPWLFFISSPRPWFLTLEHPGKFDFQGHSDVHTPSLNSFFLCLLSLLTKTQRGISSTTLLPGERSLVFAPHM